MNGPSGFVGWDEYMGINAGAGDEMRNRLMSEGERLRLETEKQSNSHLNFAAQAGEGRDAGEYDATGEAARKGLASYGEFMQGMTDPAARQALMEKTYGRGSVSWLDSALAGGDSGAMDAAQKQYETTRTDYQINDRRAEERKGVHARLMQERVAGEAKLRADQQAAAEAREKKRLEWEAAEAERKREKRTTHQQMMDRNSAGPGVRGIQQDRAGTSAGVPGGRRSQ